MCQFCLILRRKKPQPNLNPISPRRIGYISQLGDMGVVCMRYGCRGKMIWVVSEMLTVLRVGICNPRNMQLGFSSQAGFVGKL